jgi:hypothetical protein
MALWKFTVACADSRQHQSAPPAKCLYVLHRLHNCQGSLKSDLEDYIGATSTSYFIIISCFLEHAIQRLPVSMKTLT